MPTTYKGLTIPISSDLADGPTAFATYTDTLPFQVFADVTARNLWASPPNGAMCVTANDWHRWVYRSGVWMDVTTITQSRGLVGATNIGITAVAQGTLFVPAVPFPRRFEMAASTLVSGGPNSQYDLNLACPGAGAGVTCFARGAGDGTTIATAPYQFTLNANAVGDITSSVRRAAGADAGADASADNRYAYLCIKYWGA